MGALSALAFAAPASAATVFTVSGHVAGDWTILDIGLPFTLTGSPAFDFSFSFDDSTSFTLGNGDTIYTNIVAVTAAPGNQIWALPDVASSSYVRKALIGGDYSFALAFDNIFQPNGNHLNLFQGYAIPASNFVQLFDGVNSAICRECVTYSVAEGLPEGAPAVPEPATWAMMILGFGLVGGALRQRRVAAA